jgi:hypothetical protein
MAATTTDEAYGNKLDEQMKEIWRIKAFQKLSATQTRNRKTKRCLLWRCAAPARVRPSRRFPPL